MPKLAGGPERMFGVDYAARINSRKIYRVESHLGLAFRFLSARGTLSHYRTITQMRRHRSSQK